MTLNVRVVPRKRQPRAQVVTRFDTSRQNNVWEDRIWIINKSRLVERRGEIRLCVKYDDYRKCDAISN